MVSAIASDSLWSLPSVDVGTGSSTSQQRQQQQRGKSSTVGGDTLNLSPEAQEHISKLQQRDAEVRSHEQSHIAAGGAHVNGGASYSYQRGPDNKQYAVGGSVSIDTSPVPGNPEATKEKARKVRSAALAPANPSAQDQSVAAAASSMEMQAQQEANSNSAEGPQKSNASTLSPTALPSTQGQAAGLVQGSLAQPADYASRVSAAYKAVQQQGQTPTQLAPWGTGIALTV